MADSKTTQNPVQKKTGTDVALPIQKDPMGPHPDPSKRHYIIAYGSLMDTSSKNRALSNAGENIPVQINGYRREWNLKGDINLWAGSTFLGVVPDPSSHFNGLIFEILPSPSVDITATIHQYDSWEFTYRRTEVDPKNIQILGGNPDGCVKLDPDEETFWIYVNKPEFSALPSKEYPIVQSYVDVFLCGCLDVEEKFELPDFAQMAVETTSGWSKDYWVNDRIFPRRPFIHQPKAWKIDSALKAAVPDEYKNVKIDLDFQNM